jgi:hypothetical protein
VLLALSLSCAVVEVVREGVVVTLGETVVLFTEEDTLGLREMLGLEVALSLRVPVGVRVCARERVGLGQAVELEDREGVMEAELQALPVARVALGKGEGDLVRELQALALGQGEGESVTEMLLLELRVPTSSHPVALAHLLLLGVCVGETELEMVCVGVRPEVEEVEGEGEKEMVPLEEREGVMEREEVRVGVEEALGE